MATVDGCIVDVHTYADAGFGNDTKGRHVFTAGAEAQLGGAEVKVTYKMQATDPTEGSGFATWFNSTGDDTGKPGTATGVGVVISSW